MFNREPQGRSGVTVLWSGTCCTLVHLTELWPFPNIFVYGSSEHGASSDSSGFYLDFAEFVL
jgi:hypothetical protein